MQCISGLMVNCRRKAINVAKHIDGSLYPAPRVTKQSLPTCRRLSMRPVSAVQATTAAPTTSTLADWMLQSVAAHRGSAVAALVSRTRQQDPCARIFEGCQSTVTSRRSQGCSAAWHRELRATRTARIHMHSDMQLISSLHSTCSPTTCRNG